MALDTPLLSIDHLRTVFAGDEGEVRAVDDISLTLKAGRTLGLVGESGSGKSVTSLSIMRLLPVGAAEITQGKIAFLGKDIVKLPPREVRALRGRDIAMIFQEPGTSLNPVFTAGSQVVEALQLGNPQMTYTAARLRTLDLFREVGIRQNPERVFDSYPHQISGGQKQRVMIAMALSCNPKLLIADEPTTALDVTIQAQILELLRKLRDERQMAVLFISHDLAVISEIADEVAVMYRGKIVESAPVLDIFTAPKHPYTKGLLACRPRLGTTYKRLLTVADFMEVVEPAAPGGAITLRERTMSEAAQQERVSHGRGRLLHPVAVLKDLGHPFDPKQHPADTKTVPAKTTPILRVENLHVHFPIRKGIFQLVAGYVKAVDGVSFDVYPGQTLGLVGESGCGKTTTGRAILNLIPRTSGKILFRGKDLTTLPGGELRKMRKHLQIIFQDPFGSLNPRLTVETTLTGPMKIHGLGQDRDDRIERAKKLLVEVGLEPDHLWRYPHEFSGGQRQRICIARALAVEPEFIVCDESVSALDVSVQAQVLNLLKDLQEKRGLTYIFISHNLSVVKFMSDMMAVMDAGKIVEFGPSDAIYNSPQHPYTKTLIAAIPNDDLEKIRARQAARPK